MTVIRNGPSGEELKSLENNLDNYIKSGDITPEEKKHLVALSQNPMDANSRFEFNDKMRELDLNNTKREVLKRGLLTEVEIGNWLNHNGQELGTSGLFMGNGASELRSLLEVDNLKKTNKDIPENILLNGVSKEMLPSKVSNLIYVNVRNHILSKMPKDNIAKQTPKEIEDELSKRLDNI